MPAVSPAKNLGRVQGIDSSLGDLKLRDGAEFMLKVGGAVQRTPMLTRTTDGSSLINLTLRDSGGSFLDHSLLAEKLDAQIDGLDYRLGEVDLDDPDVAIALEDRDMAELREFEGPIKVYARRGQKDETTRAEFVVEHLIFKALGRHYPVTCPQLHDKQPIETEKDSKAAKDQAKTDRGKGLGAARHLTVKGESASPAQIENADRALRIAEHENAPDSAMVALIAALIVEGEIENPTGGTGTSSGWLQVTAETAASHGVDPRSLEQVVREFLHEGYTGKGGAIEHANKGIDPAESAQLCQGSSVNAYGSFTKEAREFVEAFTGGELGSGSDGTSVPEPRVFEVKKGEDFWTAIKRLAKEVNWRAFFVAGRFYFIDEIELLRGEVRLAIERGEGTLAPANDGIERVKFNYNRNRTVTEVTVIAQAAKWTPPPGSVVTLAGYGAASIGFGDAPVKADEKGRRAAISGNRKAATGEGRARYLVETIEIPLRDSDVSDVKLVTVKLKKATAPLPEPAAETRSSGDSDSTTGDPKVDAMIEEADRIDRLRSPYRWGGGHGAMTSSTGPWDCSGSVCRVLDVGGLIDAPVVSGELAGMYEPGPGERVTIYANADHVWIELDGRAWGTSKSNPGGGPGWLEEQSAAYKASFTKRHPEGM
jgi:hypothetical protein